MSTPTPRTDAAVKLTFAAGHNTVCPNFARKLERELAAERAKVRALRESLVDISDEWSENHDSPFAAGNKMQARAEKALAATEHKP